jgi:hypothetical protein
MPRIETQLFGFQPPISRYADCPTRAAATYTLTKQHFYDGVEMLQTIRYHVEFHAAEITAI